MESHLKVAFLFPSEVCKRSGHIIHCLEGDFVTELENGESFDLTAGMTYIVSDNLSSHRSKSEHGVRLLIN